MRTSRGSIGERSKKVWQDICEQFGFNSVPREAIKSNEVTAQYANWIITLEGGSGYGGPFGLTSTRMRAPFITTSGFRFLMVRTTRFPGIGGPDGLKSIRIKDKYWDAEYLFWTNDEALLRELISKPKFAESVRNQPHLWFGIRPEEWLSRPVYKSNVLDLLFQIDTQLGDHTIQQHLFELFAITLDCLVEMGAAAADDPSI